MAGELDVITAAVTGAIAGGTMKPLLAPFDAVAEHWKAKILDRLRRTDERANLKAAGRRLVVNERVAFKALVEAAFTDDPIVTEYLAGVLAGIDDPGDDEAAAVVALIGRLSGLQLRLHYTLYRALWQLEHGTRIGEGRELRDERALGRVPLFLRARELCPAPGVNEGQGDAALMMSTCRVLGREDLLGSQAEGLNFASPPPTWLYDSATNLRARFHRDITETGLVFQPSPAGIELFLWGCGATDHDPVALRNLTLDQVEQAGVPSCSATPIERFAAV